ncbi:MAG: TolC family protein [Pseudomonadota bacterium]
MKRILVSSLLAFSLSACTITPKPLTTGAVQSFANDTLGRVTLNQEPVTHAISLYEAMARALKYNLDFKVELYNEALASKQLASARLEALPNLVANAGYVGRNNNSGNTGSLTFPDKDKFQSDITLSWNILDFGLSRVRAQQAADEVLVATERRRKIINRVIEDVRTAYWRTISADRLVEGLRRLEGRTQKALRNSQALQRDGMSSPLTALTYQRELVEIQQRIQRLQKDLSLAKMQLAALMNIRPGEHFTLAMPKRHATTAALDMSAEDMVFAALENRPEIRDVQYKLRINKKETKALLLELLPGINLFGSANIDSDSYLLNSNWVGWGAKATFNLFNVFKYPAKKRTVQAKDDVLDARALAVTMAIMTQVHVSRIRYGHAKKLYRTASRHLKVQNGILRQIKASFREGQASEQTLIREEMNTLASRVSADIAYADLQNAYANIFASMGVDPYAGDLRSSSSVAELAGELRDLWIERGDRSGAMRAKRSAKVHVVTSSISAAPDAPKVVSADNAWAGLDDETKVNSIPAQKKRSFLSDLLSGGNANRSTAQRTTEPGR